MPCTPAHHPLTPHETLNTPTTAPSPAAQDVANRATNTACIAATLCACGWLVSQGTLTVGSAYTAFIAAFSLALAVSNAAGAGGEAARAAAALDRIASLLHAAVPEPGHAGQLPGTGAVDAAAAHCGGQDLPAAVNAAATAVVGSSAPSVELQHVHFAYHARGPEVLCGVSFKVRPEG